MNILSIERLFMDLHCTNRTLPNPANYYLLWRVDANNCACKIFFRSGEQSEVAVENIDAKVHFVVVQLHFVGAHSANQWHIRLKCN